MPTLNSTFGSYDCCHPLANSPLTLEPPLLKRWTVQNHHHMSEVGILPLGEQTELLSGQITLMTVKGTPHVTALQLLTATLDTLLADEPVLVITQDPIQLDDFTEPELDLAIVQGTIQDYVEQHPRPYLVYLVV